MQSRVTRRLSNIWLEMSPRPKQPDLASVFKVTETQSLIFIRSIDWSAMNKMVYIIDQADMWVVQWTTITRILLVYLVSQHLYHGRRGVIIPAFFTAAHSLSSNAISSKTVIWGRETVEHHFHRAPSPAWLIICFASNQTAHIVSDRTARRARLVTYLCYDFFTFQKRRDWTLFSESFSFLIGPQLFVDWLSQSHNHVERSTVYSFAQQSAHRLDRRKYNQLSYFVEAANRE